MALEKSDIELIKRIIYMSVDDVAVSIAHSLEQMEEHIEALESRLTNRLREIYREIEKRHKDLSGHLAQLRADLRESPSNEV